MNLWNLKWQWVRRCSVIPRAYQARGHVTYIHVDGEIDHVTKYFTWCSVHDMKWNAFVRQAHIIIPVIDREVSISPSLVVWSIVFFFFTNSARTFVR